MACRMLSGACWLLRTLTRRDSQKERPNACCCSGQDSYTDVQEVAHDGFRPAGDGVVCEPRVGHDLEPAGLDTVERSFDRGVFARFPPRRP